MNLLVILALKLARKINTRLLGNSLTKLLPEKEIIFSRDAANSLIKNRLISDSPVMIARFGATEMNCLANYIAVKDHKNEIINYIKGNIHHFWWDKNTISTMSELSGFFPSNPFTLEAFSELMLEDMKELDILGSWLPYENLFQKELSSVTKINFNDLEPYRHSVPWSTALKGKKVLVIHPFVESIRNQYNKRKLLFSNPNVLPEFELKTIKAVQSLSGRATDYKNWFEALDSMKEKISNIDFDIAIIGCGAYGFPLAAHIKRSGKKAIHLGGATQILFGIMGNRWEREKKYEFIRKMKNENWIKPLPGETPLEGIKVEDACYW